ELPIEEGQPIAEGALIASLDQEPFELSLARARAQVDQTQADFDRLQRLSGSTVSQVTIDDAETALELNKIALRDAERALRLATLRAPFDGLVARRSVPNFTTINGGTPVVRLHDMSDLRIEIEVPEVLFQEAGRDPDVALEVQFPASDRRYAVAFREVTAETTQVGQAFRLTLGMTPPEELFLLPGSSATVYARIQGTAAPLLIPAGAVVFNPSGAPSVMVFEAASNDPDTGTVRRQAVELVPAGSGAVQVLSGVEAGQEIVAAGAALLEDGASVTRFSGFAR
ncbi:MAG: efflux RND transporter periplasmic adaptor subunit, partial [Pseudomonadota bacterium]